MHQTQLINLLSTLTTKQLGAFDKYLASPYFNTHQNTYRLFEFLRQFHPEYPAPEIERTIVFEALFPGKPYEDGQLRTLRKYLLSQLTGFLAQQSWESNPLSRPLYTAHALGSHEAPEAFARRIQKLQQRFLAYQPKDEIAFEHLFRLEKLWYEHQVVRQKRTPPPSAIPSLAALDHYYIANKLQLYCSQLQHSQLLDNQTPEILFLPEILAHIEQQADTLPRVITAYYLSISILTNPTQAEESYQQLHTLLQHQHEELLPDDQVNLYIFAITYANKQYISGKEIYLKDMFELHKEMLDKELLFERGIFSVNNYRNIVTISLRLGEYTWSEWFIETYKDYLPATLQDSLYAYNLAHLYLYQKRHREALRLLLEVEYMDVFYQLSAKLLQLKLYFELEEIESFFSLAKTFQTHISRQKSLPENRKLAYHHFVKWARTLFRIQIGEKPFDDSIGEKLGEEAPLIEKGWLKSKWVELQSISA